MPVKYKYEGRDSKGKKKFSKTYVKSKWVGDYENNCVRDYDAYIKESLKSGLIQENEVQYISYFEGSFENACKFFNISGESCKVYDRDKGQSVIKENEESQAIKIERLEKFVIKHQTEQRYIMKTSAELFNLMISKMSEQYYYVSPESRVDIALQVIYNLYSVYIAMVDSSFISYLQLIKEGEVKSIDRTFEKRAKKLEYFLTKYPSVGKIE